MAGISTIADQIRSLSEWDNDADCPDFRTYCAERAVTSRLVRDGDCFFIVFTFADESEIVIYEGAVDI